MKQNVASAKTYTAKEIDAINKYMRILRNIPLLKGQKTAWAIYATLRKLFEPPNSLAELYSSQEINAEIQLVRARMHHLIRSRKPVLDAMRYPGPPPRPFIELYGIVYTMQCILLELQRADDSHMEIRPKL